MPAREPVPSEGPDVLTISEAAQALGISEVTLRRWERAGKVPCHRHPVTGWRLFVEHNLRLLERFENTSTELDQLIQKSRGAHERVEELRPRGSRGEASRLLAVRSQLASSYLEWQRVLRTPNVPEVATIDEHLRLHLGTEQFSENSSYSGSTRTRIVLSFHAALLEASLLLHGSHPGFLVLDAPKQHELHTEDLIAFFERFLTLAVRHHPVPQLVVAATEEGLVSHDVPSEVWRPSFSTDSGEPRYFGEPSL